MNAYIEAMPRPAPEYVLLGTRPEKFAVSRIIHMAKALTFSLAGRSFDTYLSKIQQKLGSAKVLDLFPEFLPAEYEDYVLRQVRGH
ncbi:MAG: penicillin acylase family protein [Calothrix sp. SM1_5_4]|nr:penicillin acylase family protein [Calothrix sp. SM1_5_4]